MRERFLRPALPPNLNKNPIYMRKQSRISVPSSYSCSNCWANLVATFESLTKVEEVLHVYVVLYLVVVSPDFRVELYHLTY